MTHVIGVKNFLNILRCCDEYVFHSQMEEALWIHLTWIWQCEVPAPVLINTDYLDFKIDFGKILFLYKSSTKPASSASRKVY